MAPPWAAGLRELSSNSVATSGTSLDKVLGLDDNDFLSDDDDFEDAIDDQQQQRISIRKMNGTEEEVASTAT